MTTSQHVSYRGGGSYLTRLRAIKSLLVYFLKCRDLEKLHKQTSWNSKQVQAKVQRKEASELRD